MKDFYDLLGVRPEATPEEIRRAYRERAQKAMWDRPRFAALNEAFETLKDRSRREEYDRQWRAAKGLGPAATDEEGRPDATREEGRGAMPVGSLRASGSAAALGEAPGRTNERTQGIALPPCPVCDTPGVPGERFCPECGFLAGSTPGPAAQERPLPLLADGKGRQFPLKAGENIVGREGADVMLPDRTVSRRHARIVVEESGEVWLEDLGSTNGTQRAGRALPAGQRATLSDGTQVQFGAISLVITIPDAPLALPLPDVEPPREPVAALNAPEGAAEAEPVAKLVGKTGQVYALSEKVTTFGRRATNHFVLSGDPYVSGAHAQVVFDGERFSVVDIGSTNGTQLNGQKLAAHTPLPLADGDEVVMGQTPLRFHTRLAGADRSQGGGAG